MSEIRTQRFLVEVSASIMPLMTERELHDAVASLAFAKERQHGMGALGVHVSECWIRNRTGSRCDRPAGDVLGGVRATGNRRHLSLRVTDGVSQR